MITILNRILFGVFRVYVYLYYSFSTTGLSILTVLSTLTMIAVAEQDVCLFTWMLNSSNLDLRTLVIAVRNYSKFNVAVSRRL